jgi:hypothetical protein
MTVRGTITLFASALALCAISAAGHAETQALDGSPAVVSSDPAPLSTGSSDAIAQNDSADSLSRGASVPATTPGDNMSAYYASPDAGQSPSIISRAVSALLGMAAR